MKGGWFAVALGLCLAVALTFLTLPVVAIFVNSSPTDLVASLDEPGALDALWLSLRTTAAALVVILLVGTPAAYLLATRSFRGRALLVTLIELPLVLPPAAAGIITRTNPRASEAPSVREASSIVRSTDAKAEIAWRT